MKKLFAIMLALMLVLTMGSALATEEPDGSSSITSIGNGESFTVGKEYTLVNSEVTDVPSEELELTVLPADSGVEVTYNSKTKQFTIDLPVYDSVGVYEYTIKEVDAGTAGVDYDATEYKLTVNVANNADYSGFVCYPVFANGTGKVDHITNTYTSGDLTIAKEVTGNMGDRQQDFTFTVTLQNPAGKTKNPESLEVTTEGLGTDEVSSNPATIVPGEATEFTLKHGQSITIANLPKGMTYTVVETAVENYETTIDGVPSTDRTASGEIANADVTVEYVNDYDNGTIDTGITTDNLPYIVLMGIVVLAGVAMIAKRRMAHND